MIIDLRSDTVTQPSKEMLQAMLNAKVGDDVFDEDDTVKALEQKVATLFNKEAALFCASGTMSNQIAIKTHTQPGDELICDITSHVYLYEAGGVAFNSGVSTRLLNGNRGRFTANDIINNINPNDLHHPITKLVCIENTCNKGGGSYYDFNELIAINKVCKQHHLKLHLDGARLFNALTESQQTTYDYGEIFDSISICLSKGLGAPVGSVLTGDIEFINKAKRIRKLFGGAMRQAGYLAAAGIYALDNNIPLLKNDHVRAKKLASVIAQLPYVESMLPVDTNIIIFRLKPHIIASEFINKLNDYNIKALSLDTQTIRFVTHLDISDTMIERVIEVLT